MTINEGAQWASDLAFFASELAAVVDEMRKKNVKSIEIDSCKTIRGGIRRIIPGLSRARHSMIRAFGELGISGESVIGSEVKKVAEIVERFKKGKKDG